VTADPRQVPTLPVLVDLALVSERSMRVTLFLSMSAAGHAGPETLDAFLNTQRRLMPVSDEAGKGELVSRDAIVLVRVMSEIAPRSDDVAPVIELVHVELVNGKTIDGTLQHAQGTRLSDFFNAQPDFFALEDGVGVVYVNKRHVISINM
jgi:hypothetical protein